MGATFTDIVRTQRQQGAGVFSSLGKAVGQRTLERIDPRNYLFSRTGLISALFPGAKGYQAKGAKDVSTLKTSGTSLSSGQTDLIVNKLDELRVEQRITSKNSLVLPLIARDMNIMRQNIIKLVKLSGGKPSNRADSFFLSAKQREEAYESRFGNKSKSPTALNSLQTKKEGGFLSDLFSGLLKASMIAGALAGIAKYFADPEFRKKVNEMLDNFGKVIFGEKYWGELKTKIKTGFDTIIDEIKKFAKVVLEIFVGLKVAGLLLNRQLARLTLAGIPGRVAMATGAAEAAAGTAAVAAAKSAKGPTVGRDPKTGKFTKKPLTKWDRFLKYLAKKSPKTFARLGTKLAALGIGASIPGPGWLLDILLGAFLVWDAWEIYNYYKEFDGQDKKTTPTPMDKEESNQIGREADTSDTTPSMLVSKPSTINEESGDVSFNQLSKGEQDSLLDAQAKQEGFYQKGTVANRLNNPGNITYTESNKNSEWVGKLGGVAGDTVKGPDGKTRTFVKYPSPEAGRAAQRKLWEKVYGSKPIGDALAKWVDPSDSTSFNNYTKDVYASINRTPQTGMTLASSVPSINDIGKFLNEGSAEFESMVREFLKSTGEVTINSDSSTKVSSTGGGQVGTSGSAYDEDFTRRLLVGIA